MLYWIDVKYATFGIVEENGIVVDTAPIAKWCLRKNIKFVLKYYTEKKKANIVGIIDDCNLFE
jgi:hypothetical protein